MPPHSTAEPPDMAGATREPDRTPRLTPIGDGQALARAGCVALDGRALLIFGAPGSGKSALALDLVALGATLVADDRTVLRRDGSVLHASPPAAIAGKIEARHIGILNLPYLPEAQVTLAIDLDRPEQDRLPPPRALSLLGHKVTLLHRPPHLHSVSGLLQCLLDRRDTP